MMFFFSSYMTFWVIYNLSIFFVRVGDGGAGLNPLVFYKGKRQLKSLPFTLSITLSLSVALSLSFFNVSSYFENVWTRQKNTM